MTVKEAMENLSECSPDARLHIVQEEELECMPQYWDDEKQEVAGKAREIFSEDVHSHQMYLLAIDR